MAASAGSQHRCVFVGNIPYDATEEQLIQICEEVGPVVSFRLVVDRETGKPKGYGFCEYKDEETALSARRNLQGYEINGRQLRVDFAENDKNADRNREQGRGGPGMAPNIDAQKQFGGPSILGDSALHQPIGLPLAGNAASLMAGALGGAQTTSLQNGLPVQPGLGNDPLTHYLSRMSRHQLNEIMSEMKTLATQNKPLARQLLQGSSQLPKALFQAQIMLGMVTPQMMQMAKGQSSSHPALPLGQTLPLQHIPQQPPIPSKSGPPNFPPAQPQSLASLSVQPTPTLSLSRDPMPQILPPVLQQNRETLVSANLVPQPQFNLPTASVQHSHLPRRLLSQTGPLNGPMLSGRLETLPKEMRTPAPMGSDPTWASRINTQTSDARLADQAGIVGNMREASHPLKLRKLDDGTAASSMISGSSSVTYSVPAQTIGSGAVSGSQVANSDSMPQPERQMLQIAPEVESALLQQVLNLTPEQLSSLPPEQQQQVLQLQKMLSANK
ncbi:cleavage stimulating factor 64 isoform X2 [Ananas comosus]|uniref:Cleavage stimulating factor 64 n=1 Tax=Ananas comosus TaxID=4615 RepID=A0A199VQC5_ANACO|nr:cleavage stimulating factor 64 isoform X2 [Ananas comosus]OAY79397.1 Cleavage stimulating factor 64 [Ananas comosus]